MNRGGVTLLPTKQSGCDGAFASWDTTARTTTCRALPSLQRALRAVGGEVSLDASDKRLLRVSKSKRIDLDGFKAGVHLETATGRAIDDLCAQVSADRLLLAEALLGYADRLMRSRPPMRRVAVGRYYYAMYHAMRAVVFFRTPGDDHEQHSDLPGWTPADFPNPDYWRNELKDARLRRNEADYDPYPANDAGFHDAADHLKIQAHAIVAEARAYLDAKGCAHL